MKRLSHTCTCIHSPPNSPPIQAATWHWAEFPVLSSRSLLVLHVKYSSVSMSIPNSMTIPSPILAPGNHEVITEYWAESPVLDSRSLLVLHVKYSSVSISIPNSLTTPSPTIPPGTITLLQSNKCRRAEVWESQPLCLPSLSFSLLTATGYLSDLGQATSPIQPYGSKDWKILTSLENKQTNKKTKQVAYRILWGFIIMWCQLYAYNCFPQTSNCTSKFSYNRNIM